METYYHGAPEIQPDGLQTLYLMNPGYLGYSADASLPSTNMVFHNSTANQVNQSQQQFVGVPLQSQPVPVSVPDVTAEQGLLPRVQYSLWNPMQSNNLTSQSSLRRIEDPHMLPAQQGLSLSLNPQQRSYTIHQPPPGLPVISPRGGGGQDHGRLPAAASSGVSIGIAGLQGALMGSKFLKVTQQLLDEVVSVGKGVKEEPERAGKTTGLMMGSQESEEASGGCGSGGGGISEKRPASDLTTAERQDIQMKKAKLLNMLDEVEQRYRQYHQQMQIVISSFEAIAGTGSARTYTALALQTISKQFRCLRDAISGQVRSTNKTLGEEDCQLGRFRSEGGSRLRFVDHQLRQQKALQQLGVMQPHNAWRPQRGLPERSVSVLRAWLFEHFLHPYPKDSDKHMLAKQTGLSRNQVSNWFINARVRLWKPMVEEMYLEEAKEQKKDTNDVNNTRKSEEDSGSKSIAQLMPPAGGCSPELYQIPTTTSKINRIPAAGHHGEDNNEEETMNKRPKNSLNNLPTGNHHQAPLMHNRISTDVKPLDTTNNIDLFMRFGDNGQGFGSYSIGEISRPFGTAQFLQPPSPSPSPSQQQQQQQYSTNGVSLTLGLQHCDGVPLSGQLPAYLSTTTDANSYTNMNDDENSNVGIMGPPENAYGSFKMTMEALVGRRAYSWHT